MDTKMMKFGVITGVRQAEVHQRPIPDFNDDEVLIRMETTNICTTDYGLWTGARTTRPFPQVGGHENSGIIEKVGTNVPAYYKVGDRVGVVNNASCGHCKYCLQGKTILCINKPFEHTKLVSEDGYHGVFGFAQYRVTHHRYLVKFNSDIPSEEAGFLEPLATVLQGMKQLRVEPNENVVVVGAGTMGMLNAQAARARGARVIISDVDPKKLACAESLGFKELINPKVDEPKEKVRQYLGDERVDAVVVAVGVTAANDQALDILDDFGRILFFAAGYPAPQLKIDSNKIHYHRYQLIGTQAANLEDFQLSAKLLDQRKILVRPLIEGSFPLEQIQQAYELASTPGSYRVSVHLWE